MTVILSYCRNVFLRNFFTCIQFPIWFPCLVSLSYYVCLCPKVAALDTVHFPIKTSHFGQFHSHLGLVLGAFHVKLIKNLNDRLRFWWHLVCWFMITSLCFTQKFRSIWPSGTEREVTKLWPDLDTWPSRCNNYISRWPTDAMLVSF